MISLKGFACSTSKNRKKQRFTLKMILKTEKKDRGAKKKKKVFTLNPFPTGKILTKV